MRSIIFLIVIIVFLFCCSITYVKNDAKKVTSTYNKYVIISDSVEIKRTILLLPHFHKRDLFNVNDTTMVDSIIVKIIEESNREDLGIESRSLLENNQYYKQILPFKSKEGKKMIWINCFCEYNSFWKSKIITVDDGGSCYFQVLISAEEKTYSDLKINGF